MPGFRIQRATRELVLNALVAIRYLKPQMPKSFAFCSAWRNVDPERAMRPVADTAEQVNLLVVEPGENAVVSAGTAGRGDSRPNHAAWRCD